MATSIGSRASGTGPYMLEEYKPGETTRAKRNPNYFRDTWFDNVELLSIIDPTARTNALLSNRLDVMDRCDLKTVKFMEAKPGIKVNKVTGYEHNTFAMIVTAPPFDNPDVRNALKYAIDREAIIKQVFGGIGTPGNDNVVAPAVKFATNPEPIHKYDPDMARSLLKKAGLPDLKVSLSAADVAFTGAVDAATIYRESAAKAGIDITVVREPNDGYWDNVWQKKPFCTSEWLGRPTADGVMTFEYAADSNQNDTFWKNPRFNELLTAARSELDQKKRAEMYAECQQLMHDDNGVIVIMFTTFVTANSDQGCRMASFSPAWIWTASGWRSAGGTSDRSLDQGHRRRKGRVCGPFHVFGDSRDLSGRVDLDDLHHAELFMVHHVAMENEASGEVEKAGAEGHAALARDHHRIAPVALGQLLAIDRHHLKGVGVDVEDMVVLMLVDDGPFLDRAERECADRHDWGRSGGRR